MIEVEKWEGDLPVKGENVKYPFRKMEVGDTFLVPLDRHAPDRVAKANRVSVACRHWAVKLNAQFIYRTTDEGLRVWRVK